MIGTVTRLARGRCVGSYPALSNAQSTASGGPMQGNGLPSVLRIGDPEGPPGGRVSQTGRETPPDQERREAPEGDRGIEGAQAGGLALRQLVGPSLLPFLQ